MTDVRTWLPASDAPVLERCGVHVWRASLIQPAPVLARLAATLSEDERGRAARFATARLREAFIASRGIQRDILSRYLHVRPDHVSFAYSARGKPSLHPNPLDLRFNVSNAGDVALYAITPGLDVGVDLEALRPVDDAERLARRFFSRSEIETLAATPAADRDAAFLTCWTRKEAYIKAVGDGLALSLSAFDVTFWPGDAARLVATRPDAAEAGRWSMIALEPGDGHVAALVVAGPVSRVRCWQWCADDGAPASDPPSVSISSADRAD